MVKNFPNSDFWKGKRVLLTGHTGFKGSWLLEWLEVMGAEVTGLSLPPAGPDNLFTPLHGNERLAGEIADLRDADAVRAVVESSQPEVVFHLAAQSLVRRGYADPAGTFAVNIGGTRNLLEAKQISYHQPSATTSYFANERRTANALETSNDNLVLQDLTMLPGTPFAPPGMCRRLQTEV